jgi:parvulin-like peptidyl-prolyl isomerase
MRARATVGFTLLAIVAGIIAGEAIFRLPFGRDLIGLASGRGHLLALVNQHAIYEDKLEREIAATRYLSGQNVEIVSRDTITKRLIADENLRQVSMQDAVPAAESHREFDLFRYQFSDDNSWRKRLGQAGISRNRLQRSLGENLSDRGWLERFVADHPAIDEETLRKYYNERMATAFMLPQRFRASHIFLAAPPGTSPEIVEAKRQWINSLADRLRGGEEFDALVWEASEDEATKPRGGDLSYFCERRIPSDFFAVVSQIKVGEPPRVIRTVLGFHLVRLTEIKPPRQISFEEARSAILAHLQNAARRGAVESLAAKWSGSSALRGRWFWN